MTARAQAQRAPAAVLPLAVLAFCGLGSLVLIAQVLSGQPQPPGTPAIADIPADYLVLYFAAASRYDLGADGWSVLAAVGKVECDHGRSTAEGCARGEHNAAGASGPAQFLPQTWAPYGVDGDRDGDRDV